MKTIWARLTRVNSRILHCWVGDGSCRSLCGLFRGDNGKNQSKKGTLDQYRRCKNCQRALES